MARPKSAPKEEIITEKNVVKNSVIEENKQLKETLSAMMAKVEELTKTVVTLQSQPVPQVAMSNNANSNRTVSVISTVPNMYSLSTGEMGTGKIYRFPKFGHKEKIKYKDMIDILSVYGHQFEKGMAIFENRQDAIDLDMEDVFDQVLNTEQLTSLVELKHDEAVDIILNMDERIQENVVIMIGKKLFEGFEYDYNKIKKLEEAGLKINEYAKGFEHTSHMEL